MRPKIKIITDPRREAAEVDFVVCHRIADLPIPTRPAHEERCSQCRERIWVGERAPVTPPRLCVYCGLAKSGDVAMVLVTPGSEAAVAILLKEHEPE